MRLRAATLAACIALVLGGCGDGGDDTRVGGGLPSAGGGGELSYALPSLPPTLDPLAARDHAAQTVVHRYTSR
jgi:hypothetical protein